MNMTGFLKNNLQCTECNHSSVCIDPFTILPLPIPNMN